MKQNKKITYGIIAFIIPLILLIIMLLSNDLLNNQIVIKGDIYAQLYPLLNYLKSIINGTNDIFYSLNKNLGGTMFGTYFYYLSSPLNLIVKYIKSENIPLFLMWLAIIKMSLCSLTMYLFMTYKHKTSNFLITALSICYGLMGYNINFFVNVMWLDVVLMTPIVLIGLDKIINQKSPILYIISLFVSIILNYYISYMLCIFCLIYFIYEILLKDIDKKQKIQITKKFITISILTGLMCSFFLFPCIAESQNYFRTLNIKDIFYFDFNIFNVFSKTFIGSANFKDILNYSSINLYCGVITTILVYLYLVNNSIPKKKRKLTLYVIILMVLPCFIFPLNYIWHLFSNPNFYNYRYSFLLCFFLLNIAYESYSNLNINNKTIKPFLILYSVISIYYIAISYTKFYDFLSLENILITILFLIIYYIILKKKNDKILCLIIIIEMILNLALIFKNPIVFSKRKSINNDYIKIANKYKNDRIEFTDFITFNDSILMEYYGINNFLSTNNNRVMRFFTQTATKKEYIDQNIYNYGDNQYILDMIIGLKYIISPYKIDNYDYIEKTIIDEKEYYVHENPNYLGISYIVNNYCNDISFDFKYDEKVFNCLFNSNYNFYKEYKINQTKEGYSSIIKKPSNFYIYYPNIVSSGIDFKEEIISYTNDYAYIKNDEKNYKFEFKIDNTNLDELKIYYFDFQELKSALETNKEKLEYRIVDNKIYGNINTEGGILMVTIPYEKGLIIKVDGKKIEYKEVLNTFVGIDLEKGNHEITIDYKQPYLKEGLIISIISLFLTIYYIKKQ